MLSSSPSKSKFTPGKTGKTQDPPCRAVRPGGGNYFPTRQTRQRTADHSHPASTPLPQNSLLQKVCLSSSPIVTWPHSLRPLCHHTAHGTARTHIIQSFHVREYKASRSRSHKSGLVRTGTQDLSPGPRSFPPVPHASCPHPHSHPRTSCFCSLLASCLGLRPSGHVTRPQDSPQVWLGFPKIQLSPRDKFPQDCSK